jgi:hypothetical protein
MLTKSRFSWFLFAFILALSAGLVFASTARADQPPKNEYTYTESNVITEVCTFPVDVVSTITAVEKDFFDANGALTRIGFHYITQDVYTANGKTIQGLPYTTNMQILFDENGEITHVYANGVIARIPLPDGSRFFSAGRLDFLTHLGRYVLSPDKGNPGNVAGFCEALAP